MNAIKVRGLACPFDKANCYNETIGPHAFDAFLASRGDKPLPMCLDHGQCVGYWEKLWTTPEGLWCEGYICDPIAAVIVEGESIAQLSIGYCSPNERERTAARLNANMLMALFSGFRPVSSQYETDNVGLREISLVKEGAFDGTHFEKVKE